MELNRKTLEDLLTLFPQLAECNTVLRKYYGKKLLDMTDEEAAELIEVEIFTRQTQLHILVEEITCYGKLITDSLEKQDILKIALQRIDSPDEETQTAGSIICKEKVFTKDTQDLLVKQQFYLDKLREHYADVLKNTPLEEQIEDELDEVYGNTAALNTDFVMLDAIKIPAADKYAAVTHRIQHVYNLYKEADRLIKGLNNFLHA